MAGYALMGYRTIGLAGDGKKPRIVADVYKDTVVRGESVKTRASGTVPHGAEAKPNNQYGRPRTIAGGKGKA